MRLGIAQVGKSVNCAIATCGGEGRRHPRLADCLFGTGAHVQLMVPTEHNRSQEDCDSNRHGWI